MASQPQATAKREPTAGRTTPLSPIFAAAVVRTLLTPKIKGRAAPFYFWRKERDSNPRRLSPQRFSRPPRSTAPPSFRIGRRKRQPFFVVFRRYLAYSSAAPAYKLRSQAAPRFQTPFPSAVLNGVRRGRRAPKCPRPSACR